MAKTEDIFNVDDLDGDQITVGILHDYTYLDEQAANRRVERPHFVVTSTPRDEDADTVEVYLTATEAATLVRVLAEVLRGVRVTPPTDPDDLERWLTE